MIEIKGTEEFIIATNDVDVFHPVYVAKGLVCTTGQPNVVKSTLGVSVKDKEDDVVNKVFDKPARDIETGEYDYEKLKPKGL